MLCSSLQGTDWRNITVKKAIWPAKQLSNQGTGVTVARVFVTATPVLKYGSLSVKDTCKASYYSWFNDRNTTIIIIKIMPSLFRNDQNCQNLFLATYCGRAVTNQKEVKQHEAKQIMAGLAEFWIFQFLCSWECKLIKVS